MNTILYVGGFELPDKNAAAQRVVANAFALKKLGYNVVLYGVDKENKNSKLHKIEENINYYARKYPQNLYEWMRYLTEIDGIIDKIERLSNVKYVVCYNFPAIALWKLKKYCNKHGIYIIGDVTEWYHGEGNLIHKTLKNVDTFLRMRVIHKRLDALIVISKYLENYYKNKIKTIYIPPLVNKNDLKWQLQENNQKNDNIIRLVYAGSPGKNKDKINKIVDFLYKSNGIKLELNIIGINRNEFIAMYPEFKDILYKMSKQLIFYGRIEHQKVLSILKEMDFSIFFREINRVTMAGFPTKFVESMSCGVPVITTKTSDLDLYLTEGVNGFWIEEDIDKSLKKIFKTTSIDDLKKLKVNIDDERFNFVNYIEDFKNIFND